MAGPYAARKSSPIANMTNMHAMQRHRESRLADVGIFVIFAPVVLMKGRLNSGNITKTQ